MRRLALAAVVLGGCNAIFGIDEARLRDDDVPADDAGVDASIADTNAGDGNTSEASVDADAGDGAIPDAGPPGCTVVGSAPSGTTSEAAVAYTDSGVVVAWRNDAGMIAFGTMTDSGIPGTTIFTGTSEQLSLPVVAPTGSAFAIAYGGRADGGALTVHVDRPSLVNHDFISVGEGGAPPHVQGAAAVSAPSDLGFVVTRGMNTEGRVGDGTNAKTLTLGSTVVASSTQLFYISLDASFEVIPYGPGGFGSPDGSLIPASPRIAAPEHLPSAVARGSRAAVAWTSTPVGTEVVWLTMFSMEGDLAVKHVEAAPLGAGARRYPTVAISDGSVAVAWHEGGAIRMQLFTLDGVAVGPILDVAGPRPVGRIGLTGTTANRYVLVNEEGIKHIRCVVP